MTPPLPDLVLYTRAGCHLCDETREVLRALLEDREAQGRSPVRLIERDIEADADLHRRYLTTIPVIEIGDRRLELATSPARIRRLLEDALDDLETPAPDSQAARA